LDIVIFSSRQSWSKEGSGEFVRENERFLFRERRMLPSV
jgi:hypothetical protein